MAKTAKTAKADDAADAQATDVTETQATEAPARKTLQVVARKPLAVPLGVQTVNDHENRTTLLEDQVNALTVAVEELMNRD